MSSILVIHMYFGTLPETFPFWLRSCEENADVDFLIVTNQEIETSSPNIIVYRCTLDEIKKRAEALLGFRVSLERPQKLCDYKAVYGLLMEEYARKYDFWGYCDSDLVFGKIRSFVTEDILNRYDYILGMGHFHIQRTNDPRFESVWKSARGVGDNAFWENDFEPEKFEEENNGSQYREVFSSPENHVFDEFPYGVSARYYRMYPDRVWSGYAESGRCFDDVDPEPLYLRDVFNNYRGWLSSHYYKLKRFFPFYNRVSRGEGEFDRVVYEKKDGVLYRVGVTADHRLVREECLYAHFLHRRMKARSSSLSRYIVRPNLFVDAEDLSPSKIEAWSCSPHLARERAWQRICFQLKRFRTLWKKIRKKVGR